MCPAQNEHDDTRCCDYSVRSILTDVSWPYNVALIVHSRVVVPTSRDTRRAIELDGSSSSKEIPSRSRTLDRRLTIRFFLLCFFSLSLSLPPSPFERSLFNAIEKREHNRGHVEISLEITSRSAPEKKKYYSLIMNEYLRKQYTPYISRTDKFNWQ